MPERKEELPTADACTPWFPASISGDRRWRDIHPASFDPVQNYLFQAQWRGGGNAIEFAYSGPFTEATDPPNRNPEYEHQIVSLAKPLSWAISSRHYVEARSVYADGHSVDFDWRLAAPSPGSITKQALTEAADLLVKSAGFLRVSR